ncbi:hypothetical protein AvCA_40680 [Azotobacter vinelandii CA]|uniref:Uncharacterized protein n=2 Tax=Azotobacter vinelandii TaxID=354 RepID=C1DE95_AZOVD|nr:hypothetical protein [Azotobacter vinelandii]ACO80203.1 hypothetical protein Avin_40680 [Azotobacter vinelandii DJ]AGK14457.1 hypothetical protein AvCA_40680 [Azotobacter vinelandii CA]AGK21766.1 hypothetical protein AvCA6_40680 [Azotobacter vinelandii CA6]WKN21001.1 hypothetical protein AVAEIV_004050 [Azotobacter vinelandii]SFX73139.1 hypothetical protein SAMN04244547_02567 [Azotobacter vinelandii]
MTDHRDDTTGAGGNVVPFARTAPAIKPERPCWGVYQGWVQNEKGSRLKPGVYWHGYRGEDFKRGPLFEACIEAMGHFIRTAPKGTLPDPFGPDGPLYGAPVRMVQPDGTVTIKRPDLTVHDASGSRVVKR